MKDSQNDFKIRKAKTWSAIHKMKLIWNSKMRTQLKIRTFNATIEPILLYGNECWTIDAFLWKKIDCSYSRFLIMATNTSWKESLTKAQL